MQIKHFVRLSQICAPSSNQDNAHGEVYAAFGGPTMRIAKVIKICKRLVSANEVRGPAEKFVERV